MPRALKKKGQSVYTHPSVMIIIIKCTAFYMTDSKCLQNVADYRKLDKTLHTVYKHHHMVYNKQRMYIRVPILDTLRTAICEISGIIDNLFRLLHTSGATAGLTQRS